MVVVSVMWVVDLVVRTALSVEAALTSVALVEGLTHIRGYAASTAEGRTHRADIPEPVDTTAAVVITVDVVTMEIAAIMAAAIGTDTAWASILNYGFYTPYPACDPYLFPYGCPVYPPYAYAYPGY
jgi:hypothetical protein